MAHPLRFGVCTGQTPPWGRLVNQWQFIERTGFDSAWVVDHLVLPNSDETFGYYEGWIALGALAAVVPRVRLGVLVTDNLFRHPAILAKQAVTVDHISGGRLDLGLGAGWYEREHEAYGLDFPGTGERVDRFREAVEIIDASMRERPVTYHGRHYRVERAPFEPAPVNGRLPLVLGANGPRMVKIAARHADTWVTTHQDPAEIKARGEELNRACAAIGRDPGAIRWALYIRGNANLNPFASVAVYRELIDRYRAAGITEFIFGMPRREFRPVMEELGAEVLPKLRAE